MPELPKIQVPSVNEISKDPKSALIKVLLGICAFLIIAFVTAISKLSFGRPCDERYDKLNESYIATLKSGLFSNSERDSLRRVVKEQNGLILVLKTSLSESSKLSKQVVKKVK